MRQTPSPATLLKYLPKLTLSPICFRCDKNGDYIRKWVPELKDVEGKAIFAPYDRLSKEEFEKLGYPKPHVDFAETAQRAKERYKRDLHSGDI